MMRNLKRNWHVRSKLTWDIWLILIQALENLKDLDFSGLFLTKYIIFELTKYRGVICNDTEEWWKIWTGIDLSFQNCHKEFDEFCLDRALESLKICTLMGCFWTKYIIFEWKRYRVVIPRDTGEWYKIWRRIDLSVQNWHEKFNEFWHEHTKISKICPIIGCLWPKYIMFELKK